MSAGIGIDLLEIERLERALERRPRLAERVFTEADREYADPRARAAEAASGEEVRVSLTQSRVYAAAVAILDTA